MLKGVKLVKPPEISIDNVDQYNFFEALKTDADNLNFFHRLAALVVRPQVVYAPVEPGEVDTQQAIKQHIKEDKPVYFLLGHASLLDIPIDSSTIQREDVFSPLRKKIHTMAKASMFKWPLWGKFITGGLAYPGYRDKDVKKELAKKLGVKYKDVKLTPEYKEKKLQLGELAIKMTTGILNNRDSVAHYPESTRRPHNSEEMLPIKRGPETTAKTLERPDETMVVVMMKAYGWRKWFKNFISPTSVVAYIPAEKTKDLDSQTIQEFMQAQQNMAFDIYDKRWKNPVARFLAGLSVK